MGEILRSYLIIVLVPGLAFFVVLRLAGVRAVNAFMWGCIAMAVVAVVLLILYAPWITR